MTNFAVNTGCKHPVSSPLNPGKSTPGKRFLTSLLFTLCLAPLPWQTAGAWSDDPCSASGFDAELRIRHIIDGDTIVLENGEKVRLIGIDTPELGRDGKPHQAGAVSARHYLQQLLKGHNSFPVKFDRERYDKYGRLLAHLFLPGGANVQALLLANGYAAPLTIPPNLDFLSCYQVHTEKAIQSKTGIWSLPQYQLRAAKDLNGNERGFSIITGQVSRIGNSQSSIWITLDEKLALRIVKEDLDYFTDLDLKGLKGKDIRARGMLYHRNKQLRIRIRHPSDLTIPP